VSALAHALASIAANIVERSFVSMIGVVTFMRRASNQFVTARAKPTLNDVMRQERAARPPNPSRRASMLRDDREKH
jgi:hypothetical protein